MHMNLVILDELGLRRLDWIRRWLATVWLRLPINKKGLHRCKPLFYWWAVWDSNLRPMD